AESVMLTGEICRPRQSGIQAARGAVFRRDGIERSHDLRIGARLVIHQRAAKRRKRLIQRQHRSRRPVHGYSANVAQVDLPGQRFEAGLHAAPPGGGAASLLTRSKGMRGQSSGLALLVHRRYPHSGRADIDAQGEFLRPDRHHQRSARSSFCRYFSASQWVSSYSCSLPRYSTGAAGSIRSATSARQRAMTSPPEESPLAISTPRPGTRTSLRSVPPAASSFCCKAAAVSPSSSTPSSVPRKIT